MRTNFIVTCGTSQVERDKLITDLGIFSKREANHLLDDEVRNPYDYFDKHLSEYDKIVNKLLEEWNKLPDCIGEKNNPFGGEISTIVSIIGKNVDYKLDEFSVVILSSDSGPGFLCAKILETLLQRKMDMEHIRIDIVKELHEDLDNDEHVETAMNNLAVCANTALIDERRIKNILIVTGGFKSTLPCLTLFASINGIEMNYLFEYSQLIQTIKPFMNFKNNKTRLKWIENWKFVLNNGNIDSNSYLYTIFQHRLENQNSVYFYFE